MTATWYPITESAPWPPRDSPGAAVFGDQIWLLGGWQMLGPANFPRLNDVWRSKDGLTWECLLTAAPWPARNLAGCVVLGGRIWLMGGFDGVHTLGDIWCSGDGRNWDRVTHRAPWGCRGAFGCLVYDNRIWVLGGLNWEERGALRRRLVLGRRASMGSCRRVLAVGPAGHVSGHRTQKQDVDLGGGIITIGV